MTVLDSHHHQGNLVISTGVNRAVDRPNPWAPFDEAEYRSRVELMGSAGVDTAIVMPVNRYLMANGIADTRRVNDAIARYRDHDPQRFVAAFGIVEPLHGDASLEEIPRLRDELGLVGISYHSRWQGVATNDPWILRQIELLGELRMLPVVHAHADSNLESPSMVGQLARTFPDVPILVMDAMSNNASLMHFLDVSARYANVYLETSLVSTPAAMRQLVAEVGAARVVFGTDTYSYRMLTRNTPEVIRGLGLRDDEVDQILSGTMSGLLAWAHDARAATAPTITPPSDERAGR